VLGFYSTRVTGGSSEDGGEHRQDKRVAGFEAVLDRAALMGLNLQSDEFWELRPDSFIRMSKSYDLRTAEKWSMVRTVSYYALLSRDGIDANKIKPEDLFHVEGDVIKVSKRVELTEEQKQYILNVANGSKS
jgi:hypothetical protein